MSSPTLKTTIPSSSLPALLQQIGLRALPANLDYGTVSGLSNEVRQKLERIRPTTLGQAARIEGMTPAALTLVLAHVKGLQKAKAAHG